MRNTDMDNETDKFDAQLHENLQRVGRTTPRPADATAQQVSRWVKLVQENAASGGGKARHRTIRFRRWLISTAAAAAAVLIILAGFNMPVSTVSADEIFGSIGKTFSSPTGIVFTVNNLDISGHTLNMQAYAGDGGQTVYAEMSTVPTSDHTFPAVTAGMAIAKQGDKAWIFIRDLKCNGHSPLWKFLPENGGLLIDWPLPASAKAGQGNSLPVNFQLRNIQALLESLRKASCDMKTENVNGTVTLTGTITNPELLDAAALGDAVDMSEITDVFLPNALPFLRGRNMPEQLDLAAELTKSALSTNLSDENLQIAKKQVDVLAKLALRRLQTQSPKARRRQELILQRKLQRRLTGARFTILYDPARKILLSVTLREAGENGGTVSLDFTGKTFDRMKLNSDRFQENPNVISASKQEFVRMILFPVQLRAAIPGGWQSK